MLLCGRSEWLFNQQQALPAGWGSGGMQSTSTEQAGFPLYNWLVQNLSVPSSLAPWLVSFTGIWGYKCQSFIFLACPDLSMEYPNGGLHTVPQPASALPKGILLIVLKIEGLTRFGNLWTSVPHPFPTNPHYVGSSSHHFPHALAKWRWFSVVWFLTRHMCWGLANWWVKQQANGEITPSSIWREHQLAISFSWLLVFIMIHSISGSFTLNWAETVKRVQNLPENKGMANAIPFS